MRDPYRQQLYEQHNHQDKQAHGGRRRRHGRATPTHFAGISDVHLTRIVAVFASTGAGIVHTLVTDDHWKDWWPSGLFFAAAGAAQFGWAMRAALRDGRALMAIGVLANAGLLLLWGVSRTVGMPFGSHAGVPEQVAAADLLTAGLELIVCVTAGWSLRRPLGRFRSLPQAIVAVCGAGLLVTACTAPAVADAAAGHSHGHDSDHSDDHPHPGEQDTGGHPHTPGDTAQPTPGHPGGHPPGHRTTAPRTTPSPSTTGHGGPGHSHANHPH